MGDIWLLDGVNGEKYLVCASLGEETLDGKHCGLPESHSRLEKAFHEPTLFVILMYKNKRKNICANLVSKFNFAPHRTNKIQMFLHTTTSSSLAAN